MAYHFSVFFFYLIIFFKIWRVDIAPNITYRQCNGPCAKMETTRLGNKTQWKIEENMHFARYVLYWISSIIVLLVKASLVHIWNHQPLCECFIPTSFHSYLPTYGGNPLFSIICSVHRVQHQFRWRQTNAHRHTLQETHRCDINRK